MKVSTVINWSNECRMFKTPNNTNLPSLAAPIICLKQQEKKEEKNVVLTLQTTEWQYIYIQDAYFLSKPKLPNS